MAESLFLGFEYEALPDWKTYTPSPQPPRNYKDPVKIEEWLDKRLAEMGEEAPRRPLCGRVSRCVVLTSAPTADGNPVVLDGPGDNIYLDLTTWLNNRATEEDPVKLYGFHVLSGLHQCALQAAMQMSLKHSWGLQLRAYPAYIPRCIRIMDILRLVFGSNDDDDESTLLSWMIQQSIGPPQPDARSQANYVAKCAVRFGLLGKEF